MVNEVTPVGEGPHEDPTEIRNMPDLIPTPGVGDFKLHQGKKK